MLCGCEAWTMRKTDSRKIEAAEMKYLMEVTYKGITVKAMYMDITYIK